MNNSNTHKKQIFFARTYRHLKLSKTQVLLFMFLFVLPLTLVTIFFYDEVTLLICRFAEYVLASAGITDISYATRGFLPEFGAINYLILPNSTASPVEILINFIICVVALTVLFTGNRKGHPVSIYLAIAVLIHTITCIFFIFGREVFPYTPTDYSQIYMAQQVGVWVIFIILIGSIMGILGQGLLAHRLIGVIALMLYSILFATCRYVFFMWILVEVSPLYMPLMFFVFGPFFDFLYFVAIYALVVNKMIIKYETSHKDKWMWA